MVVGVVAVVVVVDVVGVVGAVVVPIDQRSIREGEIS